MAEIATLSEPYTFDAIDLVQPLPVGDLIVIDGFDEFGLGLVPPYVITNRFPVPPTAIAFLTDLVGLEEYPIVFEGVGPPYVIGGALAPEGSFLEPTQGQIWPRIG